MFNIYIYFRSSLVPDSVSGEPGESIPIASEEEIFEFIDFKYRKPEERKDWGGII